MNVKLRKRWVDKYISKWTRPTDKVAELRRLRKSMYKSQHRPRFHATHFSPRAYTWQRKGYQLKPNAEPNGNPNLTADCPPSLDKAYSYDSQRGKWISALGKAPGITKTKPTPSAVAAAQVNVAAERQRSALKDSPTTRLSHKERTRANVRTHIQEMLQMPALKKYHGSLHQALNHIDLLQQQEVTISEQRVRGF